MEGCCQPEPVRTSIPPSIIRRLIDGGMLVRNGSGWRVAGTLPTALPDTVTAVLGARIDALPPAQKRALQEAAVIGRVFWETPLRLATADPDVTSSLLALEAKGLVSVHPTSSIAGELEFIFKHALVRDVAYASLPRIRRARAHAEAARWLEQIAGDGSEQFAELIGYHYRTAVFGEDADLAWTEDPVARAELRTKAFGAMIAAGAAARKRAAVPQALEFHKDAQRLLVKCAKMTGIRWGGCKVVPRTRQVDSYSAAGLALEPAAADRAWLLALRAYASTRKGDPREIDAIPMAQRMEAGEEALGIGRELGDVDLQVLATRALSGLASTLGDYARAIDFTRQEQSLVDRIVYSRERALALFWIALRYMDIEGRYEQGLELMGRSYRLAKQLAPHDVLHATYGLLYANTSLGRWQLIDALHGLALLACGDAAAARQEAERILAVKRRLTYEEAPLEAVLMVDALVALHDAEGLRAFLPQAERIRPAVAVLGPAIDRATGLLHLWEGDKTGARPSLQRALAEYERLGNPFESARTREYLAEALPADARAPLLDGSLRQYQQLGATPHAERLGDRLEDAAQPSR